MYCMKCGNKLKENSKYCAKCGNVTNLGKEEKSKKEKIRREESNQKLLLGLGVLLIIVSSIIFAFLSWDNFSDISKVLFIGFEALLFLIISVITKKLGTKNSYKALWFIGMMIVPVFFILTIYYELISSYFLSGAGLYVYLSIMSFIMIILYYLSYRYTNSKIYLFINNGLINLLITFILLIFNLNYLVLPIIILFNLIISLLSIKFNNEYYKSFTLYIKILLIIMIPAMIIYTCEYSSIYVILSNILYIINIYILLLNKKTIYNYIAPFILQIILLVFINNVVSNINIAIYFSVLSILLNLFISYLIKNKVYKDLTFVLSILSIFGIIMHNINNYKVILVISILSIVASLFLYKIDENKSVKNILKLSVLAFIYIVIFSTIKMFKNIDTYYITLLSSIIYYVVYRASKVLNKEIISAKILSYILLGITSLILSNDITIDFFCEILWIYYLVMELKVDKIKLFTTLVLVILIINTLNVFNYFYYSLITITFILFILDYLADKKKYSAPYIIGLVTLILSSILMFASNYNVIGYIANLILYIYAFYTLKDIKVSIFKVLYIILGLSIVNKISVSLIEISVIAYIVSIISIIILLIIMYLSEIEEDKNIFLSTLYLIYPIQNLIECINLNADYIDLITLSLITIYLFIILEKVLKFKKESNNVLELIWLIFVSLCILNFDIIVDVIYLIVLGLLSIIIGLIKKENAFIYYGVILLIFITIIELFKVSSSILVVISLLIVGIILVIYALIKEIKKNTK